MGREMVVESQARPAIATALFPMLGTCGVGAPTVPSATVASTTMPAWTTPAPAAIRLIRTVGGTMDSILAVLRPNVLMAMALMALVLVTKCPENAGRGASVQNMMALSDLGPKTSTRILFLVTAAGMGRWMAGRRVVNRRAICTILHHGCGHLRRHPTPRK